MLRTMLMVAVAAGLAGTAMTGAARADEGWHRGWDEGWGRGHGWDRGEGDWRWRHHHRWGGDGYGFYDGGYRRCYVTRQQVWDSWGYPHWRRVRVCG